MKERFKHIGMYKKSQDLLERAVNILDDYYRKGYRLTIRQLYYQLVSRNIIENKDSEYDKISRLMTSARMMGAADWDAIEDRLRVADLPYYVSGIKEALQDTIDTYRLDRQLGQPYHIEVWVEKDALSGVFSPVTREYHVPLLVSRGYTSVTAVYDASKRFMNRDALVLYFGDHDPSGLDMIRDIRERLVELGCSTFEIMPLALNLKQVQLFNLAPNKVKDEDNRSKAYIREYGKECWELDALPPDYLRKLVKDKIEENMDLEIYSQMIREEEDDIEKLRNMLDLNKK